MSPEGMGASISQINAAYSEKPGFLILSLDYSHRLLHTQNPIEVYHRMWSLIPRAILSFSMLIVMNFCGAELICNSLILSLDLSYTDCYILRIQLRSTDVCYGFSWSRANKSFKYLPTLVYSFMNIIQEESLGEPITLWSIRQNGHIRQHKGHNVV